jgi:hypothetical protein
LLGRRTVPGFRWAAATGLCPSNPASFLKDGTEKEFGSNHHRAISLKGTNWTINPQSKASAIRRSVSMFGLALPGVINAEIRG